jgi:hypothetical protein
MDRTGKATKDLIIDTTSINKYGPNFEGEYSKNNNGNYLSFDTNLIDKQDTKKGPIPTDGSGSLVDNGTIDGGFFGRNEYPKSKPFSEVVAGFDSLEDNPDITEPQNFSWSVDEDSFTIPNPFGEDDIISGKKQPFRKGLLKYTQSIVNNSNADLSKPGGYIGYFDSKASKKDGDLKNPHKTGSMSPTEEPTPTETPTDEID